nr:Coenzyme F420 hydrogenase/dehydrogenase, beta subunit C-terminal domain [Maliibacterium massiliense]
MLDIKTICTGCNACVNICPAQCISIGPDREGFFYPHIDKTRCLGCHICEKHCPVFPESRKDRLSSSEALPTTYAAYNRNQAVRTSSSSGGLFFPLASSIIQQGGVVFGATFDAEFNVIHTHAETLQEIKQFQGAKYVQSRIANSYQQVKRFLDDERLVMFSGTPCQIAGLYAYLQKDDPRLVTQDIICHGVPSPKVWNTYLASYIKEKPTVISFRNKTYGWQNYCMHICFPSLKAEYLMPREKDPYLRAFSANLSLRPSCYHCAFKTLSRQSDITLADFWGINKILPKVESQKGISLVLVHSEKGQKLLDTIGTQIECVPVDVSRAVMYNPSATQSATMPKKRAEFFERLGREPFDQLVKACTKLPLHKTIVRMSRHTLSRIKRVFIK